MNNVDNSHNGGCYCGAVRYRVEGPLRGVINCHCNQCRKLNGNFGAHSKAPTEDIEIIRQDGLSWFQITDSARRGFCHRCGTHVRALASRLRDGAAASSARVVAGLSRGPHR